VKALASNLNVGVGAALGFVSCPLGRGPKRAAAGAATSSATNQRTAVSTPLIKGRLSGGYPTPLIKGPGVRVSLLALETCLELSLAGARDLDLADQCLIASMIRVGVTALWLEGFRLHRCEQTTLYKNTRKRSLRAREVSVGSVIIGEHRRWNRVIGHISGGRPKAIDHSTSMLPFGPPPVTAASAHSWRGGLCRVRIERGKAQFNIQSGTDPRRLGLVGRGDADMRRAVIGLSAHRGDTTSPRRVTKAGAATATRMEARRRAVLTACAGRWYRSRLWRTPVTTPRNSPMAVEPASTRGLIVYADDDIELSSMVKSALEEEGYTVIVANDGEEGLETILVEQPDLIILDVMMPGLTGWEIAKHLRTKASFDATPIMMLTGIGERMNEMTAPLYGANAHIDKPFDIEDVIDTVAALLAADTKAGEDE
jgi:CheY-like chemotaxis protein